MSRPGRVLYVQYTHPASYPPLEHSAHLLAEAGMDIRMLGMSVPAAVLELKPHPRIQVETPVCRGRGWRPRAHYVSFVTWTVRTALQWRPTWIYASDPLACPAVLAMHTVCGARVVYHEHDSPRPASADRQASRFDRLVLGARRAVARRATICVLPNQQRADVFMETTGARRVVTVWNCPVREDVARARTHVSSEGLRLVYHGSIVPARLPLTVIDALATLPRTVALQIAGYETTGHRGYVRDLLNHAGRLGCADRVSYLGEVAQRSDLMRQCAAGDVGLALLPATSDDPNERMMAGASNKPFDYLASGLALLVSDLPDWRETFVEPGFGRACDAASAESIARELRWFLDHPTDRAAMGERGRTKILQDWNYETLFGPVMREMISDASSAEAVGAMHQAGI